MSETGPGRERAESPLAPIQASLSKAAKSVAFQLFSPFAERHGSLETVYSRVDDGLWRFVAVDLTTTSPFNTAGIADMNLEVWIGAEKDDKYIRRLHTELRSSTGEVLTPEFQDVTIDHFVKALQDCVRITDEDLTGLYPRLRIRA